LTFTFHVVLLLVRCLGIGGLLYACYLYGARPWVADAGLSLTLCSIVVGVSTMVIGDNEFPFQSRVTRVGHMTVAVNQFGYLF